MNTKSKKAQIEVSFNWVFVLIAGAIILFFFFRVITAETEITQTASQTRAITRMDAVLTALQQNPDSVQVQDRLNYELEFRCDIEGQSYNIKGASSKQYLQNQVVFSPETIGSSRPIAWVRTFKAPTPITSILYLTDQQTKYVFLTDESENSKIEHFYDLLHENISKELTDLEEFKNSNDEGYRQYIIIMDDSFSNKNFGFDDAKGKALVSKIKYFMTIDENAKKLIFYELKDNNNYLDKTITKGYFTEEAILGAIITGDPNLYECTMNKTLDQVRIIADMNQERINNIQKAYQPDDPCKSYYFAATSKHFQELSTNASARNYKEMQEKYEDIKQINHYIMAAGCPVLY